MPNLDQLLSRIQSIGAPNRERAALITVVGLGSYTGGIVGYVLAGIAIGLLVADALTDDEPSKTSTAE
jgi:membrane protein YqaA with SNARE-associated domain